jgi:hypothetical protein
MVTYVNAVHPLVNVFDGFLVHSRGATGSALRQSPLVAVATPGPTRIRTDLQVPVFVFQAETDTRATRQPDSATFRQWEVAGTAHADLYVLGVGQVDTGRDATAAQRLFDGMLTPIAEPLPGVLPACTFGVNSGPHVWVVQAAARHLTEWVRRGTLPPSGGAGIVDPVVLDANGNVTGGVRTPHVDVPVAALRGTGNSAPGPVNFCGLFGTTTPLSEAQLDALYTSHGEFVSAWGASMREAIQAGFILREDSRFLKVPDFFFFDRTLGKIRPRPERRALRPALRRPVAARPSNLDRTGFRAGNGASRAIRDFSIAGRFRRPRSGLWTALPSRGAWGRRSRRELRCGAARLPRSTWRAVSMVTDRARRIGNLLH